MDLAEIEALGTDESVLRAVRKLASPKLQPSPEL